MKFTVEFKDGERQELVEIPEDEKIEIVFSVNGKEVRCSTDRITKFLIYSW